MLNIDNYEPELVSLKLIRIEKYFPIWIPPV